MEALGQSKVGMIFNVLFFLWKNFHCKNLNNNYAMLYILDAETKSPSEIMANVVGHGK